MCDSNLTLENLYKAYSIYSIVNVFGNAKLINVYFEKQIPSNYNTIMISTTGEILY